MDVVDSEIRKRLHEQLAATVTRLRELGRPEVISERGDSVGGNTALDEVDEIAATQADDMAAVAGQRLTEQLHRIQAAIDRLDRGEYGRCVECSGEIEPARLRAMPEVERCRQCQERFERGGATRAA
jgi:RNA polymerase-binding transcription factor DksA